jgi:hypothetical protein
MWFHKITVLGLITTSFLLPACETIYSGSDQCDSIAARIDEVKAKQQALQARRTRISGLKQRFGGVICRAEEDYSIICFFVEDYCIVVDVATMNSRRLSEGELYPYKIMCMMASFDPLEQEGERLQLEIDMFLQLEIDMLRSQKEACGFNFFGIQIGP